MKRTMILKPAMLLAFFALFSACASEEETGGGKTSGEKVTVNFTVSEQSFGKTETVAARGTSSSEEKVVEEKLIHVGGNLYARTKLVETATPATRATTALANGNKVRIYAYDNETDKTFEDYADYVLNGGQLQSLDKSTGNPDPTAGLSVSPGEHYFVAISFNSATLPEFNEFGIPDILPGTDLLYCAKTQSVWASDADISLTLTHRFSQVKVSFSTAGIGSPNITAISDVNLPAACIVDFYPADNTVDLTDLPGIAVPFDGNLAFSGSSASVTSDAVVAFLDISPWTGSDVGYLEASVTIEGFASPIEWATEFAQKFEENHSYELQVDFSYLYFAGSNIYWDGDNLTFDEWGEYDNSLYQGVFFKWGSLVGISPARTGGSNAFDAANTPLYVQTAANSRQWKATTATSTTVPAGKPAWANWDDILYANNDFSPYDYVRTRNDLATYTSDQFKGDICKAISNGVYRMPVSAEFEALHTSEFNTGYTYNNQSAAATADGRYSLVGTFRKTGNIVLPAAGARSAGNLDIVGYMAYYWSSTAYNDWESGLYACLLSFESSYTFTFNGSSASAAYSVRCVTDQAPASIRIKDYLKNNVSQGAGVVK